MSRPISSKLAVDDVQRHAVGGDAELFHPAAELESTATVAHYIGEQGEGVLGGYAQV